MSKESISRIRLERILEIHKLLRQKKQLTCSGFAKYWDEKFHAGAELDRKTIQRDIEWMQFTLNAPIKFDPVRNTYYYTERNWEFPLLQVTEGEFVSLLLARQMSRVYQNTPIAKELDSFFSKLQISMTNKLEINPVHYNNIISFHGTYPQIINPKIWTTVLKGLVAGQYLSFEYRSLQGGGAVSRREVGPIHLVNMNGDWYLLGYSPKSADKQWRHFNLARMKAVRVLSKPFTPPEDFDPEEYFADRFYIYKAAPGEKIHTVTLRFAPSVAQFVIERQWNRNQKIRVEKDGHVVLSLPMQSLIEARSFCLGWGRACEVLAPPELQDLVNQEIKAMAEKLEA